jgi:hypothetical protein
MLISCPFYPHNYHCSLLVPFFPLMPLVDVLVASGAGLPGISCKPEISMFQNHLSGINK